MSAFNLNNIQAAAYAQLLPLTESGNLSQSQIESVVSQLVKSSMAGALSNSGLTQSEQNQLMQQIDNSMSSSLTEALGQQGQNKSSHASGGGQGGGSWLEAIAQAMGQALGQMAQKLVNESQSLQSEAGNANGSGAQQFQTTMAQFQADSQMFSMLSNAFSTSIKSIGDGMTTMASKQ
jgi:hypothetical protein